MVLRNGSVDSRTPGARAAKLRKLRLSCGKLSICCWVTLVAASKVRVSTNCSPTTVIDSFTTTVLPITKVTLRFWPTSTVTVSVNAS